MAMSSEIPEPSGLGLDTVSDVVLHDGDVRMLSTPPIAQVTGPVALRGALVAAVRSARVSGDADSEREWSIDLARMHYDHGHDLDEAVRLLHRALSLGDTLELRRELAALLASMTRHVEAGHVFQSSEIPADQLAIALLEAGDAYARGGDARAASQSYSEAALIAGADGHPLEWLGALAYWAPDAVHPDRAADAWIEAAARHPTAGPEQCAALACAFEVAPGYALAATAYAKHLALHQRRPGAADAVLAEHADSATADPDKPGESSSGATAARVALALKAGAPFVALGAALEGSLNDPSNTVALDLLLDQHDVAAAIAEHQVSDRNIHAALHAAVRTKSGMGRADAFNKMATAARATWRALLLSFASRAYASAGNARRATRAARQAVAAAPWYLRAHQALLAIGDDLGAADVEAAAQLMPASARWARTMAAHYEAAGATELTLMWWRRAVSLRPGDALVYEALLETAIQSGNVEMLEWAIALALAAPRPFDDLSASLSLALQSAVALDRERGLAVARRMLDVLGPAHGALFETMCSVAAESDDAALQTSLLVRRAVAENVGPNERASLYLAAAKGCLAAGDAVSAVEHACRAAAHAAPLEELTPLMRALELAGERVAQEAYSDFLLTLAHARAWMAEQQDRRSAVEAWRRLGALRWDLAGDRLGAEEAFFIACAEEPEQGPYRYAQDLCDRAGIEATAEMVCFRASEPAEDADVKMCARLYAATARLAADHGRHDLALPIALAAVNTDPGRSDAVALIEKMASGADAVSILHDLYDTLAGASLGKYGRRAAHYRGARQLEKRGAIGDALKHALAAFDAVPGVGASYQLVLRLAMASGEQERVVRAIAGVAQGLPLDGRIEWLMRAAKLARKIETGTELSVDFLLEAFMLRPAEEIAALLVDGVHRLDAGHDEVMHIRLERAVERSIAKLKGPHGARTAVLLAVLAVRDLGNVGLSVDALVRAMEADQEGTDFRSILEHLDDIALDKGNGQRLLSHINELRGRGGQKLAEGLREITSQLYLKLSVAPPPPSRRSAVPPSDAPPDDALSDEAFSDGSSEPPPAEQPDGIPPAEVDASIAT